MRIIKDTIFNYLNAFISFFINLGVLIVLSRSLGPANMGVYSYLTWIIGTLTLLFTLGLPNTIVKYVSFYKGRKAYSFQGLFKLSFQLSIFLSITSIFLIYSISYLLNLRFAVENWIISLNVGVLVLFNLLSSQLQGLRQFKALLKINLIVLLVLASSSLVAIVNYNKSLNILFIATLISNFTGSLLILIKLGPEIIKSLKNKKVITDKHPFIFFGLMSVIVLFDAIVWQRSEVFFLKIFSVSEQVAFYSLAFGISSKLSYLLSGSIGTTFLPIFSGLSGAVSKEEMDQLYFKTTKYLVIFLAPIFFGAISLTPEIINLLFGSQFLATIPVLIILLLTSFFGAITSSGSSYLYGDNHLKFMLKFGFLVAAFNLLADIIFIPRFQAIGAALANSLSQMLAIIVTLIYFKTKSITSFPYLILIKVLAVCLVMSSLLLSLNFLFSNIWITLIFKPILGIIIFISGVFFLKIADLEEWKLFFYKTKLLLKNYVKK